MVLGADGRTMSPRKMQESSYWGSKRTVSNELSSHPLVNNYRRDQEAAKH